MTDECHRCGDKIEGEPKIPQEYTPAGEIGWAHEGPVKGLHGRVYCSQLCIAEEFGWANLG